MYVVANTSANRTSIWLFVCRKHDSGGGEVIEGDDDVKRKWAGKERRVGNWGKSLQCTVHLSHWKVRLDWVSKGMILCKLKKNFGKKRSRE